MISLRRSTRTQWASSARGSARLLLCAGALLAARALDPGTVASAQVGAGSAAFIPVSADLLLQGRPAQGLVVLNSGYRNHAYVDADAAVFMGVNDDATSGDVLSMSIGLREPQGWGRARVGRFILSTGAVRPVHIDGLSAQARSTSGTALELFGGLPVVPELGERDFDWLLGGRISQWLWDERFGLGLSYLQRREGGALDDAEVGADLSVHPLPWLSLHGIASYDLVYYGLSEARISVQALSETTDVRLFAAQRVAARLLPATSLFSVISDAPSRQLGGELHYRAFPRLGFGATLAYEAVDQRLGYRLAARARLRFSDPGQAGGELRIEANRRTYGQDGYTGAALITRFPLTPALNCNANLELAAPDEARGRGALWPWARVGASYHISERLMVAASLGARSSPEAVHELEGLLRVRFAERGLQ